MAIQQWFFQEFIEPFDNDEYIFAIEKALFVGIAKHFAVVIGQQQNNWKSTDHINSQSMEENLTCKTVLFLNAIT